MKSVIYKYEIPWRHIDSDGIVTVHMNKTYTILDLAIQWHSEDRWKLCLWAVVDPNPELIKPQRFRIIGTGQPFENEPQWCFHVGTVQIDTLVLHVFKESSYL